MNIGLGSFCYDSKQPQTQWYVTTATFHLSEIVLLYTVDFLNILKRNNLKPIHLQSIDFLQGCQDHSIGKEESLQQPILRQENSCLVEFL